MFRKVAENTHTQNQLIKKVALGVWGWAAPRSLLEPESDSVEACAELKG